MLDLTVTAAPDGIMISVSTSLGHSSLVVSPRSTSLVPLVKAPKYVSTSSHALAVTAARGAETAAAQ